MNGQQIKELMKQALDYCELQSRRGENLTINEQAAQLSEKFAELIVKECMAQIEEVKQIKAGHAGPDYTQGFDDGMFVAIRTIEDHFGVDE